MMKSLIQSTTIIYFKFQLKIQKYQQLLLNIFSARVLQLMNLIKMEITLIVQNIQSIQKMSNHEDITKVKQILINSITTKEDIVKKYKQYELLNIPLFQQKHRKNQKKPKKFQMIQKWQLSFHNQILLMDSNKNFKSIQNKPIKCMSKASISRQKIYIVIVQNLIQLTSIVNGEQACAYFIQIYNYLIKMLGVYDQAIQVFDQIINVNPNFVDALCHKADSLIKIINSKYEEALSYFDKTLLLDDKNFVALSYKGETLRKMQRYVDSLIFFEKALVINPKNAVTLFGKGDALRCLRRYDEALIALNQGEQIDPNNALIQYSKGYALKAKGQIQDAIQSFQKCVVINPQYKYSLEKELASLKN